jgi:hypothetical protein
MAFVGETSRQLIVKTTSSHGFSYISNNCADILNVS